MRKFFLLIPALVLSLFTNAAVINVAPGTNTIRYAIAASTTNDGDVLVLEDGTYTDDNYIEFNKSVEVRAAEGATPIVQLYTYIKVAGSKDVVLKNIVFDGNGQGSYDYIIRQYNVNSLTLDGCEFRNMKNIVIYGPADSHTGALTVNNCYFHDNQKQAIFFAQSTTEGTETCNELTVTNSTFANTTALTDWRSIIEVRPFSTATSTTSDAIKVIIDHCTFYNNPCVDSGHANIRTHFLSDVTVSNCIFMHPTELAQRAVYCDCGGTVSNCLTYNFTKDPERAGIAYGCTVTNCTSANPLFTDAANGDFSYAGNWVTMSFSPARGAATDGSDLGDPRWYSAEVLPETDFASPYVLTGDKAKLTGRVAIDASNYLQFNNNNDASQHGVAIWKVRATQSCNLQATLNIDAENTSGHRYQIEVFDSSNTLIGTAIGESANSWDKGDKVISDLIMLSEAGDYKIKLSNLCDNSSNLLHSITLSYIGGAVQNMPGTTNINDAWFSANGTRADGKITFPGSTIQDGWVKWNVAFTHAGNYNVTVNVNNNAGHNYSVALYRNESDPDPIIVGEGENKYTSGTPNPIDLGAMEVPAGNYILKVTNATQNSDAALLNVQFTYSGGGIVTIPGTIALNEAILSERAYVDADGLHFVDAGHLWLMSEGYAKWNIHVTADGMYKFTANCNTYETSYSNLTIKVLQSGEEKYSFTPEYTYTGEKTINSPEWFLEAGDYELKLSNPANNSNGYLVSLSAAQVEGILIVDEMATDMQYITDVNSLSRKPLLKRSFTGGMYNTVVFPFNGVSDAELTTIFGAGYELLEMTSAILEGNTLNLNFSAVDLSQDTYGRPYLIKPTQDVVNPMFSSKTIYASTSHLVNSSTNADFIGSFIAGQVPAGEDNLFLGPNNLLYFWEEPTPIKGTRAYFHIKGVPHPSQSIKHANIITNGQVATSIDFTKDDNNKVMKAIENGQLIIIRNGERFTVQGQRIQ